MTKRIPSQSSVPGISTKQWTRFVMSLSDTQVQEFCEYIHADHPDPTILSHGLVQKARRYLYFHNPLVGIELNPGPNPPKSTKKRAAKAAKAIVKDVKKSIKSSSVVSASSRPHIPKTVSFASRGGRYGDVGQKRFTRAPRQADYVRALRDPFFAPAPKLGVMTFVPTAKHTAFFEAVSWLGTATNTTQVTMIRAGIVNSITRYEGTSATSTALSGMTKSTFGYVNNAAIAAVAQMGRVINCGWRAKIRAAATSLPGTLGFVFIPNEIVSNVELLTPNQITQLCGFRSASATASGVIGGEIQYRPTDTTDFEFQGHNVDTIAGSTAGYCMLIVATGWAASGWNIELSGILHLETLGGVDLGGETDGEPDLVDGGMTMDSISSAIASAGEPIVTSIEALEALDHAHSNISRARSARSLSGMISGLVGAASASSSILPVTSPQLIRTNTELDPRYVIVRSQAQ
jgi:hypothetical protein